jgi:hypothetical protein
MIARLHRDFELVLAKDARKRRHSSSSSSSSELDWHSEAAFFEHWPQFPLRQASFAACVGQFQPEPFKQKPKLSDDDDGEEEEELPPDSLPELDVEPHGVA